MGVPSLEAAYEMGAKGGPVVEGERLAFEEWMRGHCWALCATWNGTGYVAEDESGGSFSANAMRTRMLWAAWRDRAALHRQMEIKCDPDSVALDSAEGIMNMVYGPMPIGGSVQLKAQIQCLVLDAIAAVSGKQTTSS